MLQERHPRCTSDRIRQTDTCQHVGRRQERVNLGISRGFIGVLGVTKSLGETSGIGRPVVGYADPSRIYGLVSNQLFTFCQEFYTRNSLPLSQSIHLVPPLAHSVRLTSRSSEPLRLLPVDLSHVRAVAGLTPP